MAKFLWDVGPRINADMVAIGRKPMFAQNFINQIMTGAKLVEQTENCRVFTDAKGKYRLEVSLTDNTVERISKSVAPTSQVKGDAVPEFNGDYAVTIHAIERFRERFDSEKTDNEIRYIVNQALKVSTLQAITKLKDGDDAHNYNAVKYNMRLIVCKSTKTVVTLHAIKDEATPIIEKDSPLFGAIIAATKRELGKARRAFRKTNRELTEQLASIQIEMAHAMVNKTRAKGDHIVSAVERKMNELAEQERKVVAMLDAERAKFERVEADAGKVIGA